MTSIATVTRARDTRHDIPTSLLVRYIDDDRFYLRRRAGDELKATVHADCVEAEIAHNALTRAYLSRCRQCAHGRTAICDTCLCQHVCEQN
ncbi:hypothetical protein [Sphingomonas sp. IW22]|uniref:hypothetical protein n=1 Tax=Sphingomonas sp. IW22 TaxID=3242489 RepID=UPI00351FE022